MRRFDTSLWVRLVLCAALTAPAVAGCGDDGTPSGGDTAVSADTVGVDALGVDASATEDAGGGGEDAAATDSATQEDSTTADTSEAIDTTTADTATQQDTSVVVVWPAIVVNEVAPSGAPDDWIELKNGTAAAVDLEGWILRDDDPTHGYVFPAGTVLEAGAYVQVVRGEGGFDFGLGGADAVLLYAPDETLVDSAVWIDGDAPEGTAWGRWPDGTGEFRTQIVPTPGAENVDNPDVWCGDGVVLAPEVCDGEAFEGLSCEGFGWGGGTLTCADACTRVDQSTCTERAAGLVVNEVTSAGDDLVELFNGGAAAVDLEGWSIHDDADNTYVFPAGVSVAAGAYLVLTKGVEHDFGLGGDDAVVLMDASGAVVDTADWSEGDALTSFCRWPNGTGGFRACPTATFGAANVGE